MFKLISAITFVFIIDFEIIRHYNLYKFSSILCIGIISIYNHRRNINGVNDQEHEYLNFFSVI